MLPCMRGFRAGDKSPAAQIEFVLSETDSTLEDTTETEEAVSS